MPSPMVRGVARDGSDLDSNAPSAARRHEIHELAWDRLGLGGHGLLLILI
jgi:hypothetical protein